MGRTRLAVAAIAAGLAGLSASAGGLAVLASPAGAAPGPPAPVVTITDPPPQAPPIATETPTVAGCIDPDNAQGTFDQNSVSITITPKDHPNDQTNFLVTPTRSSSSSSSSKCTSTQWTFTGTSPLLPWNGASSVLATATENDSGTSHPGTSQVNFVESARPLPPSGVSASRDGDGKGVAVSWQPNPEGDILGFRVERASLNGSNWATVGTTSGPNGTSFHDTSISPRSDYQYRVWAKRSDGQGGSFESASPSATAATNAPPPPPSSALFGPGGSIRGVPSGVKANTDPVAGLVQPGAKGPNRPATGAPTAGGYSNLPYGGQAALNEPGTSGAQDPKGHNPNLLRTALFVASALILFAIAAALIRMRRVVDNTLQPVDDEELGPYFYDQGADVQEPADPTAVSPGRSRSDVTEAVAAQRENSERLQGVARAMSAYRRR